MKKALTGGLIALSALTPIASQAATGHRDKHHIASIHFTKDKTHDVAQGVMYGLAGIAGARSIMQLGEASSAALAGTFGTVGLGFSVANNGGSLSGLKAHTINLLHAQDGKTIHYRYDKNKSDKEIRTEIKRWLQMKSYLKGIKIKTDKFDHGSHTYTYKAGDTWITVKL